MRTKRFPVALMPWIQRQGLQDCIFIEITTPTAWHLEADYCLVGDTVLSPCRLHGGYRYYAGTTQSLDEASACKHTCTSRGAGSMRVCYWLAVPEEQIQQIRLPREMSGQKMEIQRFGETKPE